MLDLLKRFISGLVQLFSKTQASAQIEPEKPKASDPVKNPAPIEQPKEPVSSFPWIDLAKTQLGVSEAKNPKTVIQFLASTTLPKSMLDPSTAWCSAFVTYCLENSGMKSTKDAWARSYLSYGIKVDKPSFGDIVVFSRGTDSGHVGFFLSENSLGVMQILGGNQGDQVCIESYTKMRVLGYRRPVKKTP